MKPNSNTTGLTNPLRTGKENTVRRNQQARIRNCGLLKGLVGLLLCAVLAVGFATDAEAQRRPNKKKSETKQETTDQKGGGNRSQEIPPSIAKGGLRYRVLVDRFDDKSASAYPSLPWFGDMGSTGKGTQITQAWAELLTHALNKQGSFIATSRDARTIAREETEFQESDWTTKTKNVARIGYLAGANMIVRGAVVSVQNGKSKTGGLLKQLPGGIGGSLKTSTVTILIQIFDAQTGLYVASEKITGKARGTKVLLGNISGISLGFGDDPNMEKAASNAISKAVDYCAKHLDEIAWMGYIADAEVQNDLMINRGKREGVKVGQLFTIGHARPVYDPETGELLAYRKRPVGTLEVTAIDTKVAYCKPVEKLEEKATKKMNIWLPDS